MKKLFCVRMSPNGRSTGFTLIELLTVIAIISILAGLTAVAVPKYLEKANETKTDANMQNVIQLLSEYNARTDNTTGYPPAYGYIKIVDPAIPVGSLVDTDYELEPYTIKLGIHSTESVNQVLRYATSYDCNRDGSLSLFEYLPIGQKNVATGAVAFSETLYTGSNSPRSPEPAGLDEVSTQLDPALSRPYVYVPFNSRQLAAAKRYWIESGQLYGEQFDMDAPQLTGRMFFPPPNYDGFVLIGNGPDGTDGGLVTPGAPAATGGGYDGAHTYHILGLRIAYLATRDLNDDRFLDFDYRDRKNASSPYPLPNGTNGFGAFIKVVQ